MNAINRKKSILTAVLLVSVILVLQGCGGGGGKTSSSSASTPTADNSTISGKVSIVGLDDCSNVVVVAEKVSGGVTRTVAKLLESAAAGERSSARVSADVEGVYMASTDSACSYSLSVPADNYSVSAYAEDTVGAQPQRISARSASVVTVNFELVATGKVAGNISLGVHGDDLVLAYLDGTSFAAFADSSGIFEISNVPVGTYSIVFARGGKKYATNSGVVVAAGATTNDALTSIDLLCVMDSDCDDSNLYTGDACDSPATVSSACSYVTFACIQDIDCDDADVATADKCLEPSTTNANCQNALIVEAGTISVNTTWAAAHSPITVPGQIAIATGVTLTIEPGVVVKFAYPAAGSNIFGFGGGHNDLGGIKVMGALNAVGTAAEPITFTLEDSANGAGFWGGIMIDNGGSGDLQYVNMEYPSFGVQAYYASSINIANLNISYAGTPEGDSSIYSSSQYSSCCSYYVYAKTKTGWQEVAYRHFGLEYRDQLMDLSGYLPDADGEYKVRIQQVGMNAAQVDYIGLAMDGMTLSPVSARDVSTGEDALYKIASTDNDVWDAHLKTFEVKFQGSERKPSSINLVLNAREEGSEVISGGRPFTFPRNMFTATAQTANYYSYVMGSSQGAPRVDGQITNEDLLPAPAFAERVHPDSGHPEGTVYGYVKNDGSFLYGTLDFTTDNTMDDTADYAALHVLANGVDKVFRVSIVETTYGKVGFNYTGSVNYQHKVYEFKVPLSEIGNPQKGQEVKYLVEAYGTSSIFNSAIYVGGVNNISISDVNITFDPNSFGYVYGVKLEYLGTGPHTLTNISVDGAPRTGFYMYSANDVTINGLIVKGTKGSQNAYIASSNNFVCDNCDFSDGTDTDNLQMYYATNFAFTNCKVNNSPYGSNISLYYATGANSMTNCEIGYAAGSGIYAYYSYVDFDSSLFQENCYYGIEAYASGYGETINVTNSNFVDNGNFAIYNSGAVVNLDNVLLSGNNGAGSGVVDSSGTLSSTQVYNLTSILNPASALVTGTPTASGSMPACNPL